MDTIKIEKLPTADTQPSGSVDNKTAEQIFSNYEGKPGRHPRGCNCSRCKNRVVTQKMPLNGNPEVDTTFVKQSVESVLKASDAVLTRAIYRKGLKFTNDEALSKELALDAGMTREECDTFGTLSARVAQKHQFMGKYFEEGCLVVLGFGYLTRVFLAFKKLGEYADLRKRISGKAEQSAQTE